MAATALVIEPSQDRQGKLISPPTLYPLKRLLYPLYGIRPFPQRRGCLGPRYREPVR